MKRETPETVRRYTEKKIIKFCKSSFSKKALVGQIKLLEENIRVCQNIYDCLYYKYEYKPPELTTEQVIKLNENKILEFKGVEIIDGKTYRICLQKNKGSQ
jgi:hypothetical protein